jgi:hypothetical protein
LGDDEALRPGEWVMTGSMAVVLAYEDLTEPGRAVWDAIESSALVELPLGAPANDDWRAVCRR